ncbi:undecaprenyldiphospho-muramoylpentapeptide beta-N-acetylglucosaminyltransferase [Solemya pervernicosa gill symbiont]|uniref:UDP-N-acetylglucosamine--N-acetylmuramyl-(pentapeptide) pyrophosphoryl-undecaprenol N-acetylglucosamine transferase n=2 Tax=Gammaproteobacteria incertae sedis TaxID=118884 RepID=A0A1T2L9R8_9GAMM|nr:undecaprenyldiphospho-muramoylpentapeptide beta-N-acetylglucosaminyltransferase [Candidatus Reidiella endopervernicosa]OOZ41847.1 undecaprenyldiphospho-muramoylpentapeptide beta-N-acetylglucosaminyltransferase [Solemya pervernicosa gill symbiont]QKQ26199.1 undecaprenyldiphospho-muramoylpentapeptide beta-N-acetylglucosaminyltransferase [Candidatus Reidiella endopervernicosa]
MSRRGTVLVMAGGTGGHVFPALAVAERLRDEQVEVVWMGTPHGLESRVVPEAGFPLEAVEVQGLRGTGIRRLIAAPFVLLKALLRSIAILRKVRPDAVLGLGGFVTGPGGVAARLMGKPLLVHEQNAIAGLTNRLLSRIATRLMQAFPGSFPVSRKPIHTGNPVRADIAALEAPNVRMAEHTGPVRLLVLGGSLGAQALNEQLPAALALLNESERPVVRHQAGGGKHEEAKQAYQSAGVDAEVLPFIADMAGAYGWADLVICRAGALTVAELAAAGVASILVPFPYAVDDHQSANARYLSDAGAALLLQQRDIEPEMFAEMVRGLISDRARLVEMANMARARAMPDATSVVATECLQFCRTGDAA